MRDDIEVQSSGHASAPIRLAMISKHGDETSKCLTTADARELIQQLTVKIVELESTIGRQRQSLREAFRQVAGECAGRDLPSA